MIIIAIGVFAFCSWAVLSHKFKDGIVAKHLLSLAAILAFLAIVDRHNYFAGSTAIVLTFAGLGYAWYKHNGRVIVRDTPHRPF